MTFFLARMLTCRESPMARGRKKNVRTRGTLVCRQEKAAAFAAAHVETDADMRCRKSKIQHMKNRYQILQSFFLHVQKVFCCVVFLIFFHVLNFGFSAGLFGVKFGGPCLGSI